MFLAFDIGNTNIVIGALQSGSWTQWRLSTTRERTSDELAAFLKNVFDLRELDWKGVQGAAISSVVPSLTPAAREVCSKYLGVEPLVVNGQVDTGLTNLYDNPREVGADRLVNGVAAWTKFQSACVIADFGTATTIDAVSSRGEYLGGALSPGVGISTNALFAAAAKLPRVERMDLFRAPEKVLGTNTLNSIQSGVVFGYAGLVKELVSRAVQELRERGETSIATVATGGLASVIAPLVPEIEHVEETLTLDGLRLIWQRHNLQTQVLAGGVEI
jgi:type III pantothenate kinase